MLLYAPYTAFVLARHVCDLVCQQAALATYIFHLQSSILTKQKAINRLVKMDKENSKPRKNERKSRLKLVTSTATTAKPVIETEVYTLNFFCGLCILCIIMHYCIQLFMYIFIMK